VLVAVVHDLLNQRTFADLGELADAVKWRAARYRVPYTGSAVSDAVRLVARTRRVIR